MEKVLFEHELFETNTGVGGLDGDSNSTGSAMDAAIANGGDTNPSDGTTPAPTGGTDVIDIARTYKKDGFAKSVVSKTLPAALGYVQPINAPAGYVFGLKNRGATAIAGATFPASPSTPASLVNSDDIVITRKTVETGLRQVEIGTTNELEQDIIALFGDDFDDIYGEYFAVGDTKSKKIAKYFLEYASWRMVSKTNADFTAWLDRAATLKGTVTVTGLTDMQNIVIALGELREALYVQTGKSSTAFCLVTPRIASYLSTLSSVYNGFGDNPSDRRRPNNKNNSYVTTIGDIEIYQYDYAGNVTGGSAGTTAATGQMIMGYMGDGNTASVYYTPYKEYLVQGGSDAFTGQSSVFYRVRDNWTTNPQDTYDITSVTDNSIDTKPPLDSGKSQYLVKVNVTFGASAIV